MADHNSNTHTKVKEPALMHRSLITRPQLVKSGSGIYLTLADGRQIIDACGGAAVAVIGHGNLEVQEAVMQQFSSVAYVHTLAYTTDSAEDLANMLVGDEPFGLSKAYFVCSGSEAADAAMKLARQYHFEKGELQRSRFVSRRQAYHGNTIGGMSVGSNVARKMPYDGAILLDNVSYVSPAYAYHGQQDGETEEEYAGRLVQELDEEFQRVGPNTVIAFIAETVGGATAACITAPRGYFEGVRRVCDKYGILLILDEVMCGSGRTGTYFAFEQEGDDVRPDLVTLGKGLGGGYAPIAGVLVHQKVVDALKNGSAAFNHGHTYQAHPVSCAAALAVQRVLQKEGLIAKCATRGAYLETRLRATFDDAKYVGNIRGRGLLLGIEFVKDKASKRSFEPEVKFGLRVRDAAHDAGVAVYPGSGTVDGINGDHVILAPPLTITEDELDTVVRLLKEAYDAIVLEVERKET
ncbi:putative aminotransferase [Cladobotryum mycophilum]|uniref:Aminotransferase n=1 Tax=Cladobotryum mycophilum TaxID=491253 RepID=A0ABR0SBF3_9HYPO